MGCCGTDELDTHVLLTERANLKVGVAHWPSASRVRGT